ncbi:MAG TPA: hypothetical protein VF759_01635 [Allosphingosinicella sp.]|jgi:hypothetical protein
MRPLLPTILPMLLLVAPALLAAQVPAAPRPGPFLSPMGEPFRASGAGSDLVGKWFAGADSDGDASLTLAELQGDAGRFFEALDGDRDGEIGPAEIARYENEVAPEVQVGLQMRGTGVGDWRGPGSRRRRVEVYGDGLEGAGRYAFLNIPHPVMASDFDMNRGVSRAEFDRAAAQRFELLDSNRDGRLDRAELPPLPQRRTRRPRDDEPDDGRFLRRRGQGV